MGIYDEGVKVVRVSRMSAKLKSNEPVEVRTIAGTDVMSVPTSNPLSPTATVSTFIFKETEEPGLMQDFLPADLILEELSQTINEALSRREKINRILFPQFFSV